MKRKSLFQKNVEQRKNTLLNFSNFYDFQDAQTIKLSCP